MTMVLMFSMLVGLNAQTAIQTSKVLDNVYVGVNAGVFTPLNLDNVFPLNTTLGFRVGKNFSPVIGVFVDDQVFFGNNDFALTEAKNIVRANHLTLNGDLNLTNLFSEYRADRKFEVSVVGGLGWLQMFNPGISEGDYPDDDLTARTGMKLAWNLGESRAHQFVVEPQVLWDLTATGHGVKFHEGHAQLGVTVGYIYKFKTSNGTHNFKTYDVGALNDEINRLREELAKKPTEVVREVTNTVEVPVTNTVEVAVGDLVVFFAQGSADLSDEARAALDKVTGKVNVVATASPEGGKNYNQRLSERRAEAVAKYLRDRNVEVVSTEGLGVVGRESGRVAVITVGE